MDSIVISDEMKLAVIQAQPNTVLTVAEQAHVRRILGIPENASNAEYDKAETTFNLISKRTIDGVSQQVNDTNVFLTQEIRALYNQYDKLGDDTTFLSGGRDGVNNSVSRNRLRILVMLQMRILRDEVEQVPNEDIFTAMASLRKTTGDDSSSIFQVPIRYSDYQSKDEFES